MRRTSRLGFCSTSFLRYKIDIQLWTSPSFRHALPRRKQEPGTVVYLHREREPPVEVLEGREVRLATDFQQDVGVIHFLWVLSSEEREEEMYGERAKSCCLYTACGFC
jgi:hypothetical protein